jgi:hypothetical protein
MRTSAAVLLLCVPDVHAMPVIMPLQVFISDLALVVFGGILWRAGQAYGWAWLTCVYIIPYLVVRPTACCSLISVPFSAGPDMYWVK